jgi:transcriptional regulator with XRE-family HTH domain
VELDLGAKLRKEREAKKLSLRSVASAVGVSASLLSQVETGKTQPSVSTLYSIVTYLGLSLDELMGHEPVITKPVAARVVADSTGGAERVSDSIVQRVEDSPAIDMENGVKWERLAVGHTEWVSPIMVTYAPGGSSSVEGKLMRHQATEYGVIIEGTLTLKLEFNTYELTPGDSFCFDANRPHMYLNATNKEARGVWFVVAGRDNTYDSVDLNLPGYESTGKITSAVDVLNAMKALD